MKAVAVRPGKPNSIHRKPNRNAELIEELGGVYSSQERTLEVAGSS
jgi:hypothetical protein